MANKKSIKQSEARVLIYLNQAPKPDKYMMFMSAKLDIDYGYLNKVLNLMQSKNWVKRTKSMASNKVFYYLTDLGASKLEAAILELQGGMR